MSESTLPLYRWKKQRVRQIQKQISQILWEQWDPIGVNETPGVRDESDTYVGSILSLLLKGGHEAEIISLLRYHERVSMGMPASNEQLLLSVAIALRQIDLKVN